MSLTKFIRGFIQHFGKIMLLYCQYSNCFFFHYTVIVKDFSYYTDWYNYITVDYIRVYLRVPI